ncbi:MAG: inverse autotransporter beta domain-containing protein [Candidatus Omnitrophica bacterium]|nr:inverse autotransporter beta domain-containing protein [Candidatus Omnitrophota bacterium]
MGRKKVVIMSCLIFCILILMKDFVNAETKDNSQVPEWLKRTSYGINIDSSQKPRIYIETVQPLYQDEDKIDTFFTHGRINIQNERGIYNLGLGYRRLLTEEFLAGINTFFDYQDLHNHYRTGFGLEAIGKRAEARLNTYFGLSPTRKVKETASSTQYEKAVDGFDVELGGPVPYLPWLKLFGSYYQYDFKKFKDMQGSKIRSEIKLIKCLTINLETYDDNKGEREYAMDTRFNFAFDNFSFKDFLSAFKLENEKYKEVNLRDRTLDRVERNFNIQVEKWAEVTGMTVEIGRGS